MKREKVTAFITATWRYVSSFVPLLNVLLHCVLRKLVAPFLNFNHFGNFVQYLISVEGSSNVNVIPDN